MLSLLVIHMLLSLSARSSQCLLKKTLKENVTDQLKSSPYFSILMDGSTDSSVKDKELMYVLYVGINRRLEYQVFVYQRRGRCHRIW